MFVAAGRRGGPCMLRMTRRRDASYRNERWAFLEDGTKGRRAAAGASGAGQYGSATHIFCAVALLLLYRWQVLPCLPSPPPLLANASSLLTCVLRAGQVCHGWLAPATGFGSRQAFALGAASRRNLAPLPDLAIDRRRWANHLLFACFAPLAAPLPRCVSAILNDEHQAAGRLLTFCRMAATVWDGRGRNRRAFPGWGRSLGW